MKHFGINNVIDYRGAFLTSVVFDIHGDGNTIRIRDGAVLNGVTFYIRGHDHSVIIGAGCRFNRGGAIWIEDSGCQINIGDGSTFENVHLAVTEPKSKMTIGRDCMFAYDIDIRTGDSHSIFDTGTNARINEAQDVSVGNRVWVAAHCNILKGASIPDDSIVATGSIVTKPFQKTGTILAGNPARVVREGIRWSRERVYLIR